MKLIVYLIVAYIFYILIKGFLRRTNLDKGGFSKFDSARAEGDQDEDDTVVDAQETVLDPVCESYVPKDIALRATKGGKEYYFCSNECKDKFDSGG